MSTANRPRGRRARPKNTRSESAASDREESPYSDSYHFLVAPGGHTDRTAGPVPPGKAAAPRPDAGRRPDTRRRLETGDALKPDRLDGFTILLYVLFAVGFALIAGLSFVLFTPPPGGLP